MSKGSAKSKKPSAKARRQKRSFPFWIIVLVIAVGLAILVFTSTRSGSGGKTESTPAGDSQSNSLSPRMATPVAYDVVGDFPHDPDAFLQGLLWHQGSFYESTGLLGRSTLRHVEYPSGKVLKSVNLPPDIFGEGLAVVDNRLIQLTWKAHKGFVYDLETMNLLREFPYDTEGWGITFDGKNLIMSDGSATLTYLDPQTFKPVKKISVTMNGRSMDQLNELEFIEGEIWSNVWQTDLILRIDPATGQVKSFLDMKGLLSAQTRSGSEDVLNGIAYDPEAKRIFVSGKLWPRVYEIRIKSEH